MQVYDVIVIGAGQAGPSMAAELVNMGLKVALAESNLLGGSCVNYGCIPSKTMIASARVAYLARRSADFGIHTGDVTVDINAVIDRVQERSTSARTGLENWLQGLENLDIYHARAAFDGQDGDLFRVRVGDEVIASKRVYLNTGASAFIPPIDGLQHVSYLTNQDILKLREVPEHLLILGGGYIGLEFAQAWRRFGSQVTVIEASSHIANREDEDIIAEIERVFEAEGINILTGHKVIHAKQDDQIMLTLQTSDGKQTTISGSHLLVAVGRRPNSNNLNLESVGVKKNERGYIIVDDHLQTTTPGIYALGDVNGKGAFTHTSYYEFEVALDNFKGGHRSIAERHMAYNLYIDPPLGRVGMSEKEARQSGKNVLIATKPMSHIGRALEQSETFGLIKLLVDADTEQFLGAAVMGYHGDDVIQCISYFMATGASYKAMQHALPIHPTIAEFLPTILGELKPLK
ncbi:MAG: mercuric reductase [Phototrophicales bacterium]|nr:MAG: mercuric reductase [Phototrophicales bacterium]RMG74776.1 MAG: mercuric reductase [Chloroflexota bacterium]